jgi:hypothetical protein
VDETKSGLDPVAGFDVESLESAVTLIIISPNTVAIEL